MPRLDAVHKWLMWQGVSAEMNVETTGIDMKSGPVTSSSVGRLIACTCPQK